ncbi:MAG: hypothetical protein ACRD3V_31585 [Vicinamibacteria bacterium]
MRRARARRFGLVVLGCVAFAAFRSMADSSQPTAEGSKPTIYKGLEISVTTLERAASVSLQDCPPGDNSVRGVIRPNEENEFATVRIDVKVLSTFEPVPIEKPMLYDESGKVYKTAQSFGELNAQPSYSCGFSFRVPKGVKLTRFAIEDASFELGSLEMSPNEKSLE